MVKDLKAVFRKFNTEAKCREFLIQQRWGGTPVCPYCGCEKQYTIDNGKRFKCANNQCYKKYSVTVGTVFESSNIPLTTWLPAVYIIHSHKKGISSVQLAKDLGVTQKTSWFMLHRIREFMKEQHPQLLGGTNEIDEAYMGRKFGSEYKGYSPDKVEELGAEAGKKDSLRKRGAVVGIYNRETNKIRTQAFNHRSAAIIKQVTEANIIPGSTVYSDEAQIYINSLKPYQRGTVNHWLKEWVRGKDIHVNHVENFWSVMKRGVHGIYHQISYKHLQAYCNEFSFRYNTRDLKDGERFVNSLKNIEGRLSYKMLVYGKGQEKSSQETGQKEGE